MAPSQSSLHGLNVVQPPVQSPNPYLSDADLLSLSSGVTHFPDLNAQLDLWTHLNFQSDEPLLGRHDDARRSGRVKKKQASAQSQKNQHQRGEAGDDGEDEEGEGDGSEDEVEMYNEQEQEQDDEHARDAVAEATAHENVVTGTVLPPTGVAHAARTNPPVSHSSANNNNNNAANIPFDLGSLLAGFGIDPFSVPPPQVPIQAPQVHQAQQIPPAPLAVNSQNSLAQLLALHAASFKGAEGPAMAPAVLTQAQTGVTPINTSMSTSSNSTTSSGSSPTTKRARTSRSSVSSVDFDQDDAKTPTSPTSTSLNPAEDKRRRNTAASARFRLKKKEREAALERRAKELEGRVGELERECEGLRRENGWLKGLVVGVTGAAGAGVGVGIGGGQQKGQVVVHGKRVREEDA